MLRYIYQKLIPILDYLIDTYWPIESDTDEPDKLQTLSRRWGMGIPAVAVIVDAWMTYSDCEPEQAIDELYYLDLHEVQEILGVF